MNNYVEYNNKIAFHPGYYIKEIVEESGLTQEDFAKRLDTTPKNLSKIIRGEQSLSVDIAKKLSRLLGTSVKYWLNLQNSYDSLLADFDNEKELEQERKVFAYLDYTYFRDNYGLPDLPRRTKEQIIETRKFLQVSSLTVLSKYDMAASFRSASGNNAEANKVRANAMVQIAINNAIKEDAPKYDAAKFENAIDKALTMTMQHEDFYIQIRDLFKEAGVIFEIMPNMKGSKINGATKKIGNSIMLMVNDRGSYSDTFWFTLFHEIGHVAAGDYGISYEGDEESSEDAADLYAGKRLIPDDQYQEFIRKGDFSASAVRQFAETINRDPGIVAGRLLKERYVDYTDKSIASLRHKYRIVCR